MGVIWNSWSRCKDRLVKSPATMAVFDSPIALRIANGFLVRPWLTDIGCGIVGLWWGMWVAIHHEEVATSAAFVRFAAILPELAVCCMFLGSVQVAAAIWKQAKARQIVALSWITLWAGIASGVTTASGQAAYSGYMFLNALILIRAF